MVVKKSARMFDMPRMKTRMMVGLCGMKPHSMPQVVVIVVESVCIVVVTYRFRLLNLVDR